MVHVGEEPGGRRELSLFLKNRRARLSPEQVGLPQRLGRRVEGLRREEVAALAGVGLAWYTQLEQGRPIHVSTAFLEQLAGALRLNEAERIHLFSLAQGRLPPILNELGRSTHYEQIQSILDVFSCPAYLRDSKYNVLAWNAANTAMFGDFEAILQGERNVLKLMFLKRHYKETMSEWENDAKHLVAKFRLNLGQTVNAAEFMEIVQCLDAQSEDFRRIWAQHDVSNVGEGVTQYVSKKLGKQSFRHRTICMEGVPELRVVLFIPIHSG